MKLPRDSAQADVGPTLFFPAPTRSDDASPALVSMALEPVGVRPEAATPSVFFVGAGPGDPDLLTVRALKLLGAADVVLYDALVSDDVLRLIKRGAKRIAVGKRAGAPCIAQSDINRMLVRLARPGRKLVRLKGGDPLIFARLGEEIATLEAAGVPFEIIPGVTAASAAAAAAGVSLTTRGEARRVQFVTAHARAGEELALDWRSLADDKATTVFYMAREAAAQIAARLMAHGLGARTPVLLMSDVSRPSQMRLRACLCELQPAVDLFPPGVPLIIVVGEATAAASIAAHPQSDARAVMRG
ncbi:uroporphyrin-III C-methyltransferase [Methylocella silvestris BL2]|uniref:uroporphyrinogen-III C-methyltransferase n=1 Tax=Methylocella silvestris (strain DSM 15510 / CIP 108128 / LMG 27833 / NCIMB 13906 / BL2) TaxID=395965 RepID=B8EJG0_METSB|nr:uroporphyrinogen-III C-methyltransferase [Methylocella silvestris]ACK52652.1 uroporphyrin-III C-methyltransferase [Methylocella silvestris BL2]